LASRSSAPRVSTSASQTNAGASGCSRASSVTRLPYEIAVMARIVPQARRSRTGVDFRTPPAEV
jgi:hypothetical protein